MTFFEEIMENQSATSREDTPFDKAAWIEKKQAERHETFELIDTTALEVAADSERFQSYLDTQSNLPHYSAANILLINAQRPEATRLKDYEGWQNEGVAVRRNERHIKILEPGEEYIKSDGSVGTNWNVKQVFDISQTDARPLSLPQNGADERHLLGALLHHSPVALEIIDKLPHDAGAYYDHDEGKIFVRRTMATTDIFRGVAKELAHAELAYVAPSYDRAEADFSAFCVAYVLCQRYGIENSDFVFSTAPAHFQGSDSRSIRETLTEINETAKEISGRMFRFLSQEHGVKETEQER